MPNSTEPDCTELTLSYCGTPSLDLVCAVVRRTLIHRYRGVPMDIVHDAVQEAACKLCERGRLRSEVNQRTVYSWIYTTASRELGHTLRRLTRTIGLQAWAGTYGGAERDRVIELAAIATGGNGEGLNDLLTYNTLLDSISRNLAEAVQLHVEGYTADEIAAQLGCTRAAAYKRVQRGCFELRALWHQEEVRVAGLIASGGRRAGAPA